MNCPICGKQMEHKRYTDERGVVEDIRWCKSNCYREEFVYGEFRTFIFGEIIFIQAELDELIKYWKENDRYLMKLMGV